MASSATKRYDHDQFVNRFLEGLSSALGANQGGRARGVKRSLDETRDSKMSTSMKVLNARMALGADDQTYLTTGLGLLWAGDPNPEKGDEPHLLFPSSMGNAATGQGARQALQRGLLANVEQQIANRLDALVARLPALVHVLSLPEVAVHVKADLEAAGLWSNNPTSLAALVTSVAPLTLPDGDTTLEPPGPSYAPAQRHQQSFRGLVDNWTRRIERARDNGDYIEEVIVVCAVLHFRPGLEHFSRIDRRVIS